MYCVLCNGKRTVVRQTQKFDSVRYLDCSSTRTKFDKRTAIGWIKDIYLDKFCN